LAAAVRAPQAQLRVAAQYGCHALRPSDVARFDNPLVPTIFEDLIRLTGAQPVEWSRRLDCCGDPLHEANAALAGRMTQVKIASALESGAEALCTACPHCHLQFNAVSVSAAGPAIRTVLVTQLLGLALGLSEVSLGM
jgi:heterodisulfide reductase subunit B